VIAPTHAPRESRCAVAATRRLAFVSCHWSGRPLLLTQAEKFELSLIQTYLPSTADEATTRGWVEEAIAAIGATKPGDVGKVMGAVMKGHRSEVDGALVKKVAAELLSA